MALRVWAKFGLFSRLHFLLASCSSPAIFPSSPRCSASLETSLKKRSTALIVTFSNVYVLLSLALLSSLLSPRHALLPLLLFCFTSHFHSPSSFSHHLFIILYCCCSDIHTLLWKSWPSMGSTSMSPLLHFILYSSFSF